MATTFANMSKETLLRELMFATVEWERSYQAVYPNVEDMSTWKDELASPEYRRLQRALDRYDRIRFAVEKRMR